MLPCNTPPPCTPNNSASSTFRPDCIFCVSVKATGMKTAIKYIGGSEFLCVEWGRMKKLGKWGSHSCKRNNWTHSSNHRKGQRDRFLKAVSVTAAVMEDSVPAFEAAACVTCPPRSASPETPWIVHSLRGLCLEMRSCSSVCLFQKSICHASCSQNCYWNSFAHLKPKPCVNSLAGRLPSKA